jgi:hypothetical protein
MTKAYTDTYSLITESSDLEALVLQLQSGSALGRLSHLEAIGVFQLLLQRGYQIVAPKPRA